MEEKLSNLFKSLLIDGRFVDSFKVGQNWMDGSMARM